jgi:hypothetical protein
LAIFPVLAGFGQNAVKGALSTRLGYEIEVFGQKSVHPVTMRAAPDVPRKRQAIGA